MDDSMITPIDLVRERINILNVSSVTTGYNASHRCGDLDSLNPENVYIVHYEFQYKPIDAPHTWCKSVLFLDDLFYLYERTYKLVKELKAELEK